MDDDDDSMREVREVHVEEEGRRVQFLLRHSDTDHIQRHIHETKTFYELAMLRHARTYIQPGDLVVDIGAYIGNHTLFFAGVCQANVVSFEPHPVSYAQLVANVGASDLSARVTTYQAGVGAAAGSADTSVVDERNGGSNQLFLSSNGEVRVLRLDDLELPAPVKMIKIDVEGMEMAVLAGAEATIQRDRPVVYVECADVQTLARVVTTLTSWGFSAVSQFNATPTLCFVPTDDASLNTQVAHTTWFMDRSFSKVSRRLGAIEADHKHLAASLDSLASESRENSNTLNEAMALLHQMVERDERVERALGAVAETNLETAVGVERVERTLHTLRLRTEASLARLADGVPTKAHPRNAPSAPQATRSVGRATQSLGSGMLASTRRKLRKLERDPESFFEDSKNGFVKNQVGPFYLRRMRVKRGK